jgi:poly(A) polymerase
MDAVDDVFHARIGDVSGGGKLAGDMREIWVMQPRFEKRVGSTPFGLVEQPRFRAAFDFMRLRADIGEVDELLADWWQEFSMADDNLRQDLVDQVRAEQQQRPRAPRVHRAPREPGDGRGTAAPAGEMPAPEGNAAPSDDGAPPRKRRRRRRGGGGSGGSVGSGSPAQGTSGSGESFDG